MVFRISSNTLADGAEMLENSRIAISCLRKTRFRFYWTARLRMGRREFQGCGIFSMFVLIDAMIAYFTPFYILPFNLV